jgi:hypothetical protein
LTSSLLWNLKFGFTQNVGVDPQLLHFTYNFLIKSYSYYSKVMPRFSYILDLLAYFEHLKRYKSINPFMQHSKWVSAKTITFQFAYWTTQQTYFLTCWHPPPSPPQRSACPSRCLKILAKASLMLLTLFCFVVTHTRECALTYILKQTIPTCIHVCVLWFCQSAPKTTR